MDAARLSKRHRERLTRALQILEHGLPDEDSQYRHAERCGAVRAILEDVLGLPWKPMGATHTEAPADGQAVRS
jgi:hypothetical protein